MADVGGPWASKARLTSPVRPPRLAQTSAGRAQRWGSRAARRFLTRVTSPFDPSLVRPWRVPVGFDCIREVLSLFKVIHIRKDEPASHKDLTGIFTFDHFVREHDRRHRAVEFLERFPFPVPSIITEQYEFRRQGIAGINAPGLDPHPDPLSMVRGPESNWVVRS